MNIAIISPGVLPVPAVKGGAVENLIQNFINENEKNKKHNITVFSIYSKDSKRKCEMYEKCKFEYINIDGYVNKLRTATRYVINKYTNIYIGNLFIKKVSDIIKNNIYDVILIENRPEFALKLSNLKQGRIVLHLHNDILNVKTKKSEKIVACYDKIISVSNFIGNKVREINNQKNIVTVYNGIDINKFNKEIYISDYESIRSSFGIKKDEIVLFYAGRLNYNKGIKQLMKAFINMKDKKNIKLLISGSVTFGNNINDKFTKELMELSKISEENIIFTGYIEYEELARIYSISDIVIVPSIGIEAAPLTVIEGLSTGIPVIRSNSGGIPELADETCSIMVKIDENYVKCLERAIKILVYDSEKRKKMSNNARNFSLKFSIEKYYKNMTKELEEIIEVE